MTNIEKQRTFWAGIAKENGWYQEPFYVQVWLAPDGSVHDSVSSRILESDIIVQLTEEDMEEE
jgi:hypothetical protein